MHPVAILKLPAHKAADRFKKQGLNPDVVEKLFADLVQCFIAEEMKHWEASS